MDDSTTRDLHPSGLRDDHMWPIALEDLNEMGFSPFFGEPTSTWLTEHADALAAVIPIREPKRSVRARLGSALARTFDVLIASFEELPDFHDL
jgi:hypothetical protein